MKIRPLHDRVIIRRIDEEKTTAGGIVIPDSAKEKPIKGEVIAVGSGKVLDDGKTRKLDVEIGNVVDVADFYQLLAAYRSSQHHPSGDINPMQRKYPLCQIDPHGSNLFHDFPSRLD